MIMEYNFDQRSPEWFAVRRGKLTGSRYPLLMPKPTAKNPWTAGQTELLTDAYAEIQTKERKEFYTSKEMEWGTEHEEEAIRAFEVAYGVTVRECGFFENSDIPRAGASPDGIFEKDDIKYTLEIKCPLSHTHSGYMNNPKSLWEKYKWQVVGESLISGIAAGPLVSFDPRFKEGQRLVIYIPGDIETMKIQLLSRLSVSNDLISKMLELNNVVVRG